MDWNWNKYIETANRMEKLPAVYVGNKIVVRIADLEYFLQENLGKNLRDQNDVISCDAVRI